MKKLEINHHQHYALDTKGNLVYIKDAPRGNQYKCPSCNKPMIARMGEHNEWHFAHSDNSACNYDKYLHTLAEIKICKWFNEEKSVWVTIDEPITKKKCKDFETCNSSCKGQGCIVNDYGRSIQKSFDLKKHFIEAKREQSPKGIPFVADILCNRETEGKSPLFIEICVTHPCIEEKKNSGIRIIEFVIKSEKDIENIISGNSIQVEGVTVNLFGFKRKEQTDDTQPLAINLKNFILFKDDEWKIYPGNCRSGDLHMAAFEIGCKGRYINAKAILAKAMSVGMATHQKLMCRYNGDNHGGGNVCLASEKFGLSRICRENYRNCFHYEVTKEDYEKHLAEYEELKKKGEIVYEWIDALNRYKYQF